MVIIIKNGTGYYNVTAIKDRNVKQGIYYKYTYIEDDKIKTLFSLDLRELRLKVKKRDLKWKITDNKLAIETKKQNILNNVNNEIKWDEID